MPHTRNSNAQRGDFSRGEPNENTRAASGPSAEHDAKLERLSKLPGHQGEAIKALEFGISSAGREFKEHGSEPDKPIVDMRPQTPNESPRTDQDRHGGRDKN
jgi:hypothetical protein